MHTPKIGEHCTLGGLEFEVTVVGAISFSLLRITGGCTLIFSLNDVKAFTWLTPPVTFTEEQCMAMDDYLKCSPVSSASILAFMRSHLK